MAYSDLNFLLEPPVPFADRHAFEAALREIAILTHRFANSFVYVKGYELYTAEVSSFSPRWSELIQVAADTTRYTGQGLF